MAKMAKKRMGLLDMIAHTIDFVGETIRSGHTPGAGWTSKAMMDMKNREHGQSPFGGYQTINQGNENKYDFSLKNKKDAPAKEADKKPGLVKANVDFVNAALYSGAGKVIGGIGALVSGAIAKMGESKLDKQERQLGKLEKQLDKHDAKIQREDKVAERRQKLADRVKEHGGRIPDAAREKMNEYISKTSDKAADSKVWQKEAVKFEKSQDTTEKARFQSEMNQVNGKMTDKDREALSGLAAKGAEKAAGRDIKAPVQEQPKVQEQAKSKVFETPKDKDGKPVWSSSYMSKAELQTQATMEKNITGIREQLKNEVEGNHGGDKEKVKEVEIKLKTSISEKNEVVNVHKAEFAKDPDKYVKENMGNFQQNEQAKEQSKARAEAKTATLESHGVKEPAKPEHKPQTAAERLVERQAEDRANVKKGAAEAVKEHAKAKETPAPAKDPEKSNGKSITD